MATYGSNGMQTRFNPTTRQNEQYTGKGWEVMSGSTVGPTLTIPIVTPKVFNPTTDIPTSFGSSSNNGVPVSWRINGASVTQDVYNTYKDPKTSPPIGITVPLNKPRTTTIVGKLPPRPYTTRSTVTPVRVPSQSELNPQNGNVSVLQPGWKPTGAPITQLPDYSDTAIYSKYEPPKDETVYLSGATFTNLANSGNTNMFGVSWKTNGTKYETVPDNMPVNKCGPNTKCAALGSKTEPVRIMGPARAIKQNGEVVWADNNKPVQIMGPARAIRQNGEVVWAVKKPTKVYDSTMNPAINPFGYAGTGVNMGNLTPANIALIKAREKARDIPVDMRDRLAITRRKQRTNKKSITRKTTAKKIKPISINSLKDRPKKFGVGLLSKPKSIGKKVMSKPVKLNPIKRKQAMNKHVVKRKPITHKRKITPKKR